jgi:hypothetical protein
VAGTAEKRQPASRTQEATNKRRGEDPGRGLPTQRALRNLLRFHSNGEGFAMLWADFCHRLWLRSNP